MPGVGGDGACEGGAKYCGGRARHVLVHLRAEYKREHLLSLHHRDSFAAVPTNVFDANRCLLRTWISRECTVVLPLEKL